MNAFTPTSDIAQQLVMSFVPKADIQVAADRSYRFSPALAFPLDGHLAHL
jgi:hypothetical protein